MPENLKKKEPRAKAEEKRRMECGSDVSGLKTKDDVLGQLSLSSRCVGVL